MLSFDEIVGQPMAVGLLRGLLARDRVPHALVFHGPEGVGKATLAETFAAAMLCEQPHGAHCSSCPACRLLERGNHPDLLRVGRLTRDEARKEQQRSRLITAKAEPAEADLSKQILIHQIRSLNGLVGLSPRMGRRRIFIIDPADRLNREAQNALLKTLEEPPERTVLMLVASRPHLLIPTVRSRSFAVGLSAMPTTELAAVLEQRGIRAEEAAARAALAGGRLGVAVGLDLDARRSRREEVLEMLEAMSAGPHAMEHLPSLAAVLAGKDEPTLVDGLDLAQGLLRDAARSSEAADRTRLLNADLGVPLARLGRRLGPIRAADLVATIERLRSYLRFNTNRSLIAESLLAAVAGGPLP